MEKRLLAILRLALKYNASDIHFTSFYNEISIQMRIDGRLVEVKSEKDDIKLIRYMQYLANLDIGNILLPQSGQFEMDVDGKDISLRFSIINKNNLSNGVLRILTSNTNLDPHNLSLIETQNTFFNRLFNNDIGLILFSGPTGSGKTTTIYTLLKNIKNKKIYTAEDPIEVYYDNMIQIEINEKIGFDYEKTIEQLLRHDPDIIMVGEIRDQKAAKMASFAANTGHLVLSTIHSSYAHTCINRMVDLGVNEDHLYENLICIVNQRIVNLCDGSKKAIYEIMDKKEIDYYRKNKTNSKEFISINAQIQKGIMDGIIKAENIEY